MLPGAPRLILNQFAALAALSPRPLFQVILICSALVASKAPPSDQASNEHGGSDGPELEAGRLPLSLESEWLFYIFERVSPRVESHARTHVDSNLPVLEMIVMKNYPIFGAI
jgi:hypothetical protein